MNQGIPFAGGVFLALLLLALPACKPEPTAPAAPPLAGTESITNHPARGVVLSLKPEGRTVVIRHEEIPGYMIAMTMPFEVRDTNELKGLKKGDGVEFRLRVTETDGWIDQVRVVSNAPAASADASPATTTNTPPPGFRVLPKVADLAPGEMVPDYAFTNQMGKRFALASYRGQALAVTFIFTRCPFPLFCPRMSDQFAQVQRQLFAAKDGPTNWQLLSLTFDPAYDTPETMEAYGKRWKADASHWTLATGGFDQIEPFAISAGLYFGRDVEAASLNHNLRTLVIGPDGKLKQILVGNEWTPADLVTALTQAARERN